MPLGVRVGGYASEDRGCAAPVSPRTRGSQAKRDRATADSLEDDQHRARIGSKRTPEIRWQLAFEEHAARAWMRRADVEPALLEKERSLLVARDVFAEVGVVGIFLDIRHPREAVDREGTPVEDTLGAENSLERESFASRVPEA